MSALVLGLALFLGNHSVRIDFPGFRDAQIAINERRWAGLYSPISIIRLVLII